MNDDPINRSMSSPGKPEGALYELQLLGEEIENLADALNQHYDRISDILKSPEPESPSNDSDVEPPASDLVNRIRNLRYKATLRTREVRSITRRVEL